MNYAANCKRCGHEIARAARIGEDEQRAMQLHTLLSHDVTRGWQLGDVLADYNVRAIATGTLTPGTIACIACGDAIERTAVDKHARLCPGKPWIPAPTQHDIGCDDRCNGDDCGCECGHDA